MINIGLIGCGGRSRFHVNGLTANNDVRIVAVCDLDVDRAKERAQPLKAAVYTDMYEMLSKEQLDGVCISTAAMHRGDPEIACIEANIPFLVEKPVALDMDTARSVAKKVDEAKLITCVGYQLRYFGSSRAVSRWSAGKKIGLVEGRYWCGAARSGIRSGPNQLHEQVTHTLDLIRMWAGEIEEVFSYQSRSLLEGEGLPDVYAIAFKLAHGGVGTVSSTWGSASRYAEANMVTLFAGEEKIEFTGSKAHNRTKEALDPVEGPSMHDAFIEAIKTGDASPILTPYQDAVMTLAVSLAADQSALHGRPVNVKQLLAGLE